MTQCQARPASETRPQPEDGYQLWLRYPRVQNQPLLDEYRRYLARVELAGTGATLSVIRTELALGLESLLGTAPEFMETSVAPRLDAPPLVGPRLVVGTPSSSPTIRALDLGQELESLGAEGFAIGAREIADLVCLFVAANDPCGLLYGVFHLLRQLSLEVPISGLRIATAPRLRRRMLSHWDNLDRTIERGYAGFSLWDWHKLPDYVDPRLVDYARANASIGINGTVLTNVNANALILTNSYLRKVQRIADVLRPYNVRVYLTARFNAPVELKSLETADPLDPDVVRWWQQKVDEIYALIPDFGGFVVKANSEGQPGPHNYGRSHADGANLLATALSSHGGIVLWRAFVYDAAVPSDRAKQAYQEFVPEDGRLLPNACLLVKNGPIDFQPREPFHPLFGSMPNTPLFLELQITQEYLGQGTHLVFLGPVFEEVLRADTRARGPDSTVARVIDGTLDGHTQSGMVGVSNIGTDRNWCGHPFAAANWYAFGRLAWDHALSSRQIAKEWLQLTFSRSEAFVRPVAAMMLQSREACVDYMTPLGLHHLMAWDHHYGPGPWVCEGRPDWTSVYFHRADEQGVGFDRSANGSQAIEQYHPEVARQFATLETCPESYLLWFHHVAWGHRMHSGRTLWEELCLHYETGVDFVRRTRALWQSLEAFVDAFRFEHVSSYLAIQEREARWWRDACTQYFQQFSRRPFPAGYEPPEHPLEYYRGLVHYYVPGIKERRFE
ncbi:MAG: alpha-glucuronidase family glycosyl hydrolase [Myxococcales bacterium]